MSSIVFVGVDPGLSGAIAAINQRRKVLFVDFFPVTETSKSPVYRDVKDRKTGEVVRKRIQGKKRELDFVALSRLVARIAALSGDKCGMVEQVTAGGLRKMGATSAFSFGGAYSAVRQCLADYKISFELVSPRVWQDNQLTGIIHGDSSALRAAYLSKARTMFPELDLSKKKHAEHAAALLIADYCRKTFRGVK